MATQPPLPLFYRTPEPLHSAVHAHWRLCDGDASFAAHTACVPILAGEVAAASRTYPVVFAGEAAHPLAIVGLEERNLFVEDGGWVADAYLPAYVRRYPFAFIRLEPEGFALAIDTGSGRFRPDGEDGMALFQDGQPTELTRQALAFCDAFRGEAEMTSAFSAALVAENLLIDRRADATLPDGRKLGLDGFRIVDEAKFRALPDATVLDWHGKGWLALVHFHLASLDRFTALLDRQAALKIDQMKDRETC